MDSVMGYDHFLGRKKILKFVYYFMIIFVTVYIFKYFLLLVPFSQKKYNNVLILNLIIFYLNM
jgi:hypothetical protein